MGFSLKKESVNALPISIPVAEWVSSLRIETLMVESSPLINLTEAAEYQLNCPVALVVWSLCHSLHEQSSDRALKNNG